MKSPEKSARSGKNSSHSRPPARTPEALENEMISLAMDLAAKQLREGTASSQIITHFLQRGSTKEAIEKETMQLNKELIKAKTESIQSGKHIEELYSNALKAMGIYSGGRIGNLEGGDDENE